MNWLQQIAEWLGRLKCWFTVRPWEKGILVRFGRWIQLVDAGMHVRLPLVDEVFIQNTRQRVLNLPVQTVTTRGGQTITLSAIVQWRIADVRLLYEQLHTPEDWIYNVVLAAIAQAVYEFDGEVTPKLAGEMATQQLHDASSMGLEIASVAITDFSIVRTYRLITGEGNSGWSWSRVGTLDTPHQH